MQAHCSRVNKGSFYDLRLLIREIKVINIKTASWYRPQFKVNILRAFPLLAPPQTTAGLGAGRKSSELTVDSRQDQGEKVRSPLSPGSGLGSVVSN